MKAKELIKLLELNPDADIKIARASMDGDIEWCTLETEYEDFDEEDILVEKKCFKLGRSAEANNYMGQCRLLRKENKLWKHKKMHH